MNQDPGILLVTTDGSPHSRRVLPHAAAFARTRGDRIVLLRVVDPQHDVVHEPRESREASLNRALVSALADNATSLRLDGIEGEPLSTMLGEGEKVADAIVRVAAEQGAVMIAMDTRGHDAMHHALHGSNALEVLARTTLPVLLTGAQIADVPATEPYRIVVTSDGSPASEDVIRALAPLLSPGRFAASLLRIHERTSDARAEVAELRACEEQLASLRSFFPDDLEVQTHVREIARMGGIDTAIIEEARRMGARSIAASTHGISARRHLFAGNTALLLLGRSPLPVIMARAPE
jgi:nucleotide-binding universal stress UspA family protein